MTSPIYFHPWIYECVMRILYWGNYQGRIREAADRIPRGISIADVCAGDCSLLRYGLLNHNADYRAYDINPRFVRWAEKRGIYMQKIDIRKDEIPPADCVVMLSALYQFIPHERTIVDRLIHASKQMVILTEPVRNIAQNSNPLIRWGGQNFTRVGDNPCLYRFTEEQLSALLTECGFQSITPIARGRELLAVYSRSDSLSYRSK